MNLEKVKKTCHKLLRVIYGLEYNLVEINVIPTFSWDEEKSEWAKNSCSIFINVNTAGQEVLRKKNNTAKDIELSVEAQFIFECIVNITY